MDGLPALGGRTPFEKLSRRKRAFVENFVRTGDAMKAVRAAGYKEGHTLKVKASNLKRELSPYIADKIYEYAHGNELAVLGLNALSELVVKADSDSVRLSAARELVKLTLPEAPKEVNINHNVKNLSDDEIDKRLQRLMKELDPKDVTPYVERLDAAESEAAEG